MGLTWYREVPEFAGASKFGQSRRRAQRIRHPQASAMTVSYSLYARTLYDPWRRLSGRKNGRNPCSIRVDGMHRCWMYLWCLHRLVDRFPASTGRNATIAWERMLKMCFYTGLYLQTLRRGRPWYVLQLLVNSNYVSLVHSRAPQIRSRCWQNRCHCGNHRPQSGMHDVVATEVTIN